MRIHDFAPAPNPTKLRVYLNEKGIEVPRVMVNLLQGEQNQPDFLALNPLGGVPVLELDDGTCIAESLAIIEYFEELQPEPPLIGREPLERARVRSLERSIDIGVLMRTARIVHAKKSPLPGVAPDPALVERELPRLVGILRYVDERIGSQPFVAGPAVTIADCTLFAGLRFGELAGLSIDPACENVRRWYERFAERPSAQ